MSIDLRCRHDRSVRELAAGMFDEGRGYGSVAKSLGIPARAVRKWQQTYRAVGRDGLLNMGKTHARCFCQAIDEHSGMHELNTLAAMP